VTRLLSILQGCAAVALIILVALAIFGGWPMWPPLIAFGAILVFVLFERSQYKTVADRPHPGWEATGEKFIDPETGKQVVVYYDPKSGQRQYVNE
jgi:fatty acid desaturase